ncbi:UNVERIFIED_CONTAM: hypothetical protein K2H54_049803 [Gekko kuhli]
MEPGVNTPPLPAEKPAKCRGKSWTRPEIKDLLALWGDSKTQKDLSGGKRNFEIFEEVAVGMAARGHSKNAFECRAKSKAMRLRYKKVVALNATSGHEAVEQPQHSPSHPPAAMQVEQPQHSPSHPPAAMQVALPQLRPSHPPAAIQTTGKALGHGVVETSGPHLHYFVLLIRPPGGTAPAQTQPSTSSHSGSESHHTTDADDVPPVAQPSGHGSNERPVRAVREPEEAMESRDRDPEELPPDVAMADLTAGERSALTKSRKKRVSALQSVGELIATQAREEHREAMRADERRY